MSEGLAEASAQAEYIIGVLVAVVSARYLFPAALSLLGGLAEALLNLKAVFPGSQHPGWILALTTAESVPPYMALLAMLMQVIGDPVLAIAFFCIAPLYTSLGTSD